MTLKTLTLMVSTLLNLSIATYVLSKGPRKMVNRSLSLFVYTLATWSMFNFLVAICRDVRWVAIFGHWSFATGSLLTVAALCFSIVFPGSSPERKRLDYGVRALNYAVIIMGGLMFFLSFTRFVQKDVYSVNGVYRPRVGFLHPLFVAYVAGGMSLSLFYLFKKWKSARTLIETIQLKILFLGLLIGAPLAILTNGVLPALGFPQLVSLGPTFTVIVVGFIAYSIVKYRLLDITFVVKRTVLYAFLTGFITALYIVTVLLAERLLRDVAGYQTLVPAVFVALVIAFLFLPLRERFQNFVDRVFYRKKYEYQKVLSETGKGLTRALSLSQLLDMILRNVTETMGIKKGSIWLAEEYHYALRSEIGLTDKERGALLRKDSKFTKWVINRKDAVILEELERLHMPEATTEVERYLRRVGAEIAIPILREENLMGIIFLGSKESGDVFTQEDIDLLLTLAAQASVAILYVQVEEAKLYQESILKNLTGGVITVDNRGQIVVFNQKAQELTGFSSQAVGRPFAQVLKDPIVSLIEDTLHSGKSFAQREVNYAKEKDKSVPLAVSSVPLKDATGKAVGAIVVLVDLTEIRRLEQELYQAEKLASLGTLAAGMAHEIKNPLQAIHTFLQLLPEKFGDAQFRESFCLTAMNEAKRINEIVQQILSGEPAPIKLKPTDVHKVIDSTLAFLSAELEKKSIEVVKNYSEDGAEIHADGDKLRQVFLNLFLNGMENMEAGGTFTIDTSFVHQGEAGLASEDSELIVEVKDTGKGIPPEVLPRIFDPFFSTKKDGTGLGLFMVHRIITDHGGTIKVKKTGEGKGTCFILNLPVHRGESQNG